MKRRSNFNHIDIFAGCGGLSLGLFNTGCQGIFAIEKDSMAFETLKLNLIDRKKHFDWPDWLPVTNHDINSVLQNYKTQLKNLRDGIDLVAGGPPCQGFSIAGKRNEKDERNQMVDSYIKFIDLVRPRMLFFENVKGFTQPFKKQGIADVVYSEKVICKLKTLGYNISSKLIDFSEFGVPQKRKRFIIYGAQEGDPDYFFEKLFSSTGVFLEKKGLTLATSAGDALSDLEMKNGKVDSIEFKNFKEGVYGKPKSTYQKLMKNDYNAEYPDSHRFVNHQHNTIKRFKYILKNCERNKNLDKKIKERYKIKKLSTYPLAHDQPCPTLTTLPDDYIHYNEPRILTVREYARLQSFNDWYSIRGNYTTGGDRRKREVPRYSQIGNAIPPLFMEQCGEALSAV